MPHSSGGFSGGGGFHSGSSSHGGNSGARLSSRPFPGACCYVYYDRRHRARKIYSNGDPAHPKKTPIGTYILLGVFVVAPVAIILFTGFHNPSKIPTSYTTNIVIKDDLNTLAEAEEDTLRDTFDAFFATSGICPSFVTIPNSTWKAHYASLEGYAYDRYLNMFKDESHWLIVYAADGANKENYALEGMQGNDTDPVLSRRVTDRFNDTCFNNLQDSAYTVGQVVNDAFRDIMPSLMDHYFYVEPGIWAFTGIWEGIMVIAIASTVIQSVRIKNMKGAVKAEGDPKLAKCEFCGNEYYEGTIDRCPNCQADLTHPRYARFESDNDPK